MMSHIEFVNLPEGVSTTDDYLLYADSPEELLEYLRGEGGDCDWPTPRPSVKKPGKWFVRLHK